MLKDFTRVDQTAAVPCAEAEGERDMGETFMKRNCRRPVAWSWVEGGLAGWLSEGVVG